VQASLPFVSPHERCESTEDVIPLESILCDFVNLQLIAVERLWISKVKELEATVEEQRSEISRLQDELRTAKPSTITDSEFFSF